MERRALCDHVLPNVAAHVRAETDADAVRAAGAPGDGVAQPARRDGADQPRVGRRGRELRDGEPSPALPVDHYHVPPVLRDMRNFFLFTSGLYRRKIARVRAGPEVKSFSFAHDVTVILGSRSFIATLVRLRTQTDCEATHLRSERRLQAPQGLGAAAEPVHEQERLPPRVQPSPAAGGTK